jgi:hypothetical protein
MMMMLFLFFSFTGSTPIGMLLVQKESKDQADNLSSSFIVCAVSVIRCRAVWQQQLLLLVRAEARSVLVVRAFCFSFFSTGGSSSSQVAQPAQG